MALNSDEDETAFCILESEVLNTSTEWNRWPGW